MANKKPQAPRLEYYESATCGPHVYVVRIMEYWLSTLLSRKEKIGFQAILKDSYFEEMDEFAAESKAEMSDLLASIPMGGVSWLENSVGRQSANAMMDCQQDALYKFKGITKHPAFAGRLSMLRGDYVMPTPSVFNFVFAHDQKEALELISACRTAYRERNQRNNQVLTHAGQRIKDFRKMDWKDIFLHGDMLKDIRDEIESFFKNKDMYAKHGLDWRRGMLLAGPPGNGKTSVVRAVATSAPVPVIYWPINDNNVLGMIDTVQETVCRSVPAILVMEDADAMGIDDIIRSAFLNCFDGMMTCDGLFTIATTNSPDKLDPAFTGRPSRFDSYYVLDNPEAGEREKIFLHRLGEQAKPLAHKDIKGIIDEMQGLSAACVQEVAVCAMLMAMRLKKPVRIEFLRDSLAKVKKHMKASKDGSDKWAKGSVGFSGPKPDKWAKGSVGFSGPKPLNRSLSF